MQNALGNSLIYDPWLIGLGSIMDSKIDPKEAERRRYFEAKSREDPKPQFVIKRKKAEKIADFLYTYGESDTRLIRERTGVENAKKIVGVMTYMSFYFDGEYWSVYETDDGCRVGLVNSKAETPNIKIDNTVKYKYVVRVDNTPHYFFDLQSASDFIGCDRNSTSKMVRFGRVFDGIENVSVEYV